MEYHLTAMSAEDLLLLRDWLDDPHVGESRGDAEEEFGLVSGDMSEPAMDQYVVSHDNVPFGYLQCYRLTDWNICFGPQPEATRGIDQMIDAPEMVGRGHGSALIRVFVENLLGTGTPRVVVDPDPGNARAIRAYEKAGFVRDKLVGTPDGISLLMVRDA